MLSRRIKRLAIWVLGICVLLVAGLLALPTVLGTKWIYQPLVDRLAADDFLVSVDGVRLRWFSPLKFDRIEVKQSDGTALISVEQIRTDRGLFGYLIGGRKVGRIEIVKPTVDVRLLEDSNNLDRFIKAVEGKTKSSDDDGSSQRGTLKVDVDVAVIGASASVKRESTSLVVIPPFDLNVQYVAASGPSRLIVAPTSVLKEVVITPELVDLGLGHAIPLLAKSAWFDGRVSLDIGEINVPLNDPLQAKGDATVTLHTVRSGPSEPAIVSLLEFIAQLRGRTAAHEFVFVDGSQVALSMQDAHVTHSGLQVGLPKIDPRLQLESSGSVGLADRSLALNLAVPVPVEQIARRDSVKELGVPKINVPIGGTLDKPKIEWSVMRGDSAELIGLVRGQLGTEAPGTAAVLGALEGLADGDADQAISAAADLIKELRDRRRAANEAKENRATDEGMEATEASTTETQATSERPFRDALRNIFRRRETPQ